MQGIGGTGARKLGIVTGEVKRGAHVHFPRFGGYVKCRRFQRRCDGGRWAMAWLGPGSETLVWA